MVAVFILKLSINPENRGSAFVSERSGEKKELPFGTHSICYFLVSLCCSFNSLILGCCKIQNKTIFKIPERANKLESEMVIDLCCL